MGSAKMVNFLRITWQALSDLIPDHLAALRGVKHFADNPNSLTVTGITIHTIHSYTKYKGSQVVLLSILITWVLSHVSSLE